MTDTWTWATVTQATPLRIKVDGDTSELDATTDNLVGSLAVLDRVRVHLHADGIIVTGVQGGVVGTPEATAATANTLALRDGDGQLKAADGVAADDVATVGQLTEGDIDWTGVTYYSGFGNFHPAFPFEVCKLGRVIFVRGLVERDTNPFRSNTTYADVATLPTWARPTNKMFIGLGTDTSEGPASGAFADDGGFDVRMGPGTDADWVGTGGLSWPAV